MKKSSFLAATLAAFCIPFLLISGVRAESPAASTTAPSPAAPDVQVETLVCIRHGEKPAGDLGQINERGLNRALALPDVLIPKYGKPNFIFAPGTQHKEGHHGVEFWYIRPLMTIEPTAIRLGMEVDAQFAWDEIDGLQKELLSPAYRNSLVFVAWEHAKLEVFVRNVVAALGGDAKQVPEWDSKDFDSIYVVRIRTENGKQTVTFEHDQEGLNGMSAQPPAPAKREALSP